MSKTADVENTPLDFIAVSEKFQRLLSLPLNQQRNAQIIEASRELRQVSKHNREVARQIRESCVEFRKRNAQARTACL